MTTARLIAITMPVIPELTTPGDLIAYCARVSNPANQANAETAPRLLRYLYNNRHWSPFEMASMTVEVTTTRDIARQVLRHRSFSFQEFSQRYAEVMAPPVVREARMQDLKNRQDSQLTDDQELKNWWEASQLAIAEVAHNTYREALYKGIAKEVARSILPEGTTESKLYMAGTIRSWMHFVDVRRANGTQREHQQIAMDCELLLMANYPELAEVLRVR